MSETPKEGFPVVLTADRTLMARYRFLLDGMVSASQTTATPETLWRLLTAPPVKREGLRVAQAPLGLRRVEAALLTAGFPHDEVAVVRPEDLFSAVGRRTRIAGISSGDPLGIGMNSTTMTTLMGGEIWCGVQFRRLAEQLSGVMNHATESRPSVVMGGPGAWQLTEDHSAMRRLGIDHVISGYCEAEVGSVFSWIMDGHEVEPVIGCSVNSIDAIPAVRGATTMGTVEISRGCGMGCGFCTMSRVPMRHLPVETILRDIETNLRAGVRDVSLISEDFLRYGGAAGGVDSAKLKGLLRAIRGLRSLGLIQVDHANVASVAAWGDADLAEVHSLLAGESAGGRRSSAGRHLWLNLGVETASGELIEQNGGGAKMRPFRISDWADICTEQVRRLSRLGFLPMVSLVIGMPGETEEHLTRAVKWVEAFGGERVSVFPVFYVATDGSGRHFTGEKMTTLHWRLFEVCYSLNFKWIPRLYNDSRAAAGGSFCRRLLMGALGRLQTATLKRRIARFARGCSR